MNKDRYFFLSHSVCMEFGLSMFLNLKIMLRLYATYIELLRNEYSNNLKYFDKECRCA